MYYTKLWNPLHYKCKICNDEIWSKFSGEFVSCKCGVISIDQTEHYTRFIGEYNLFKEKENEKNYCNNLNVIRTE